MEKYKIDPELIFLLRQDIEETKGEHRKIRIDNLFSEEDYLIADEFNKYVIDDKGELVDKTKPSLNKKEKRVKKLERGFIEVSTLTQKAADDSRYGCLKVLGLNVLVKYKNNIENSMRMIIDSNIDYFELTDSRETHPNYEKAMVCAKKGLDAIKEEIMIKRMFGA